MLHLHNIKPRIGRLKELLAELCQDYKRWKEEENPLLLDEKRAYLRGIQKAFAGIDEARVVLSKAVKRFEALGLPPKLT
jgi:hypothetical protein